MTKDDLIRMARETGLLTEHNYREIINFGSMVAAAEREACAKEAESYVTMEGYGDEIAYNIRARGQS